MDYLEAPLRVGDPDVAGPLAVFPLFGPEPRLRYRSFSQACPLGAEVTEVPGDAAVADLVVANPTDLPFLLYEGEPASVTSHPGLRYLPALDGLRALAVAAVIAYHLGLPWARGGYLGVALAAGVAATALLAYRELRSSPEASAAAPQAP